jgi:hypothetical protein
MADEKNTQNAKSTSPTPLQDIVKPKAKAPTNESIVKPNQDIVKP